MRELATVILMGLGAGFMLLAAIGVLRLPDLFTRMHAATKAATLGVACSAAATIVHFGPGAVGVSATLIIVFLFATAPVAAHVMARAAYRVSVPLWKRSVRDELRPLYDGKPPPA
jgi:multicomponent Na+:H+ antiporter subunit G